MTDEKARMAELERAAEAQLEADRRLVQSMANAAKRDGGC